MDSVPHSAMDYIQGSTFWLCELRVNTGNVFIKQSSGSFVSSYVKQYNFIISKSWNLNISYHFYSNRIQDGTSKMSELPWIQRMSGMTTSEKI